jgi:hypothetical protein
MIIMISNDQEKGKGSDLILHQMPAEPEISGASSSCKSHLSWQKGSSTQIRFYTIG